MMNPVILYKIYKRNRLRKYGQIIADRIYARLQEEISEYEFDMLIQMGYLLNNYCIYKGVYLS
jgi:hypothetical protein